MQVAGGLDAVINNAGVESIGPLKSFAPDDWQESLDINVFDVQRVTRAVLPLMRAQGAGLLVFVSSIVGWMVLHFFGPCIAEKFDVEGLAETYRSELSVLGIETCNVKPGVHATSFIAGLMQPSDHSRDAVVALVNTPVGDRRELRRLRHVRPALGQHRRVLRRWWLPSISDGQCGSLQPR